MTAIRRNTRKYAKALLSQKLRPATSEDLEEWSDNESDATMSPDPHPLDLDEPWSYTFRPGEPVWVRTVGGNWHRGRVSGRQRTRKGLTRESEGLFYPVVFNEKLRKYFAPLNGEIKPDTAHVRQLLKAAGWL